MAKSVATATLRIHDHDVAGPPRPDDLAKLSVPLTRMLTAELDEAQRYLRMPADEIVLAALGRTFGRTMGSGDLSVDIVGDRRSTVPVGCVTSRKASATRVLRAVHHALAAPAANVPRPDVLLVCVHGPATQAYREALPGLGHAVELRTHRSAGRLQMDWWYDTRRLERGTVEEFTEQFPLALIELTSEALPIDEPNEMVNLADAFALADS